MVILAVPTPLKFVMVVSFIRLVSVMELIGAEEGNVIFFKAEQFVIDIFCNIVNGAYLNNIIKKQQRLDEKQQLYKKEQEQLKKEDRIDAERFERIAKQNKQKEIEEENELKNEFNEFATKIRKLKEVYEVGGISQEEYIELKENFIYEIKSLPLPKDIDPLSKIKEAKELLDDNDITQEEFEIIKTKYIEIL